MTRDERIEYYYQDSARFLATELVDLEDAVAELKDLHEPFPIYPIVLGTVDVDDCPHCGENIDDTWRDLHVEDSEGSLYVLCLTKGPEYLVCRECSNDGADDIPYPCNTLKIFGVEE